MTYEWTAGLAYQRTDRPTNRLTDRPTDWTPERPLDWIYLEVWHERAAVAAPEKPRENPQTARAARGGAAGRGPQVRQQHSAEDSRLHKPARYLCTPVHLQPGAKLIEQLGGDFTSSTSFPARYAFTPKVE